MHWIDPVASLAIAAVVVFGTWGLMSESLHLAVDGVPRNIDIAPVRNYLRKLPGVTGVSEGLNTEFGVGHTTLQMERNIPCPAKPCEPEDKHRNAEHMHQGG